MSNLNLNIAYTLQEASYKGRDQLKKKNVFFRALPELPKPPPHDPILGNLVLFFSEVKIQDLKVSLELKILYIYYMIYCIYAT